jgi:integrase
VYLQEEEKDYKKVCLEDLINFLAWLSTPNQNVKINSFQPVNRKRTEKTINLIVTAIINFYDYLYRNQELENDLTSQLTKRVFTRGRTKYKDFLYHINKSDTIHQNLLKVKEPRKKIKALKKEEVQRLITATTNIRDKLLIQLLFESGLRIGEALSLFLEDFIFDHKNGHRIQLVDRGELENGAKLKTGERAIYISQELINLYDDYLYEVFDCLNLKTNFAFVKIRGKNVGQAMNYQDVSALFKRLRKKTGINVHPHLLRHTHATIYYKQTKDIKQVQERLGHSQIQTTINMYIHLSDEEIREDWEKVHHVFRIENENSKEG